MVRGTVCRKLRFLAFFYSSKIVCARVVRSETFEPTIGVGSGVGPFLSLSTLGPVSPPFETPDTEAFRFEKDANDKHVFCMNSVQGIKTRNLFLRAQSAILVAVPATSTAAGPPLKILGYKFFKTRESVCLPPSPHTLTT